MERMRLLDAAAAVLGAAAGPMRTQELVSAMRAMGLWATARGKTPDRTLSRTLHADIKGADPTFALVGPGLFALRKAPPPGARIPPGEHMRIIEEALWAREYLLRAQPGARPGPRGLGLPERSSGPSSPGRVRHGRCD